ncbi:MAG: tRNA (adenosine(37)-N6)-threonylcarbamoyltransferase complex ATPase subunit type 1 TsaE [Firmicutes bacterium HGW-Firmicutes-1]|jgi:tRNA threonylcarbamoyladenosine biosynthesis protein TsaE|nr:MAG: tRNA (adenosine(37)-N6)-threonylcarbamoyltransferase complex ATPase subunit type 1 TsaE [Firmicutes bacterium HGW-Firmicutes-1]
MIAVSQSPEETMKVGKQIGLKAEKGQVYCLVGDLGVGKTIFTKGFAKGLGIKEQITSPTFTIVNEYEGDKLSLYHFDVYRIQELEEMDEIGYEDYFYGEGVTFIEWANYIEDLIPEDATWIYIEKDLSKGLDYRLITIQNT